jgi:hypothetical protein
VYAALYYGAVCAVSGYVGLSVVRYLVKKYQKSSLIIFSLAIIIALSALVIGEHVDCFLFALVYSFQLFILRFSTIFNPHFHAQNELKTGRAPEGDGGYALLYLWLLFCFLCPCVSWVSPLLCLLQKELLRSFSPFKAVTLSTKATLAEGRSLHPFLEEAARSCSSGWFLLLLRFDDLIGGEWQ